MARMSGLSIFFGLFVFALLGEWARVEWQRIVTHP
jgi:hypothetical protein